MNVVALPEKASSAKPDDVAMAPDVTYSALLARAAEGAAALVEGPAPASLRLTSYGGAKMPESVLERFPTTDFVTAYGLTETSWLLKRGLPYSETGKLLRRADRALVVPHD